MSGVNHVPGPEHEANNERAARLFRTATLIWATIVAWLAFRPVPSVEAGLPWDKLHHAAAFVVLTVLCGRGWLRLPWPVLVLIMLAAGIGIELVQGLPAIGRDADVWDVVADAVGLVLGLAVLAALRHRPARTRG